MSLEVESDSLSKVRDDGGRHSMLIVGSDADSRALIRAQLPDGCDLDEVATGEEALARLASRNYSVILADLTTLDAGWQGFIMALPLTTPVLVITADAAGAISAMKMGAFDYLIKPLDPRQVTLYVKRALESDK